MTLLPRRSSFAAPPGAFEQQLIPIASVLVASIAPLLPVVATYPIMPPFGFVMLLSWRLLRNDLWPVWAALPLGLFDDLFSGAPIGTAAALWTATLLGIDAIDRRFVWRDHLQDWALASAFIIAYLMAALVLSGGSAPPWSILTQALTTILLFPLCIRLTAVFDRSRLGR